MHFLSEGRKKSCESTRSSVLSRIFYPCKLQTKLAGLSQATSHPISSHSKGYPRKTDLPFTQDSVNKKTRFQNVNPLLIPIFFLRMKSRRPHLAHLRVPGSRGLDSFALLSPLRLPFILFASSGFWLLSPAQWSCCCCWCAVTARSEWCFWDTTATLTRTQPSLQRGHRVSATLDSVFSLAFFSPPPKLTLNLAPYNLHQKALVSLGKPRSAL